MGVEGTRTRRNMMWMLQRIEFTMIVEGTRTAKNDLALLNIKTEVE